MHLVTTKFKVGDIVHDASCGMTYEILDIHRDSFDDEWWYKVNILDIGRAEYYRTGEDDFPIFSCDHSDELAIGYMAVKEFDKDLEDLLK
jgi:hypothetical protein